MGADGSGLVLQLLVSSLFLKAAWTTIWVATVAQVAGTLIGVAVAPMSMARSYVPRILAFAYQWVFRGTPLLAQILFFYAVLPQMGFRLGVVPTGLLALGLNEGARMAEIVRSGLLAVDRDQRDAASALGLRPRQVFFLVVLPQAFRAIIPPLGNNYTYMIKATSLLSVISFAELLRTSQQLAQSTGRPLEVYIAAAIFYLVIVTVVTLGQHAIERHVTKHQASKSPLPRAAPGSVTSVLPDTAQDVVVFAQGLRKRLGATQALDGVDLAVQAGEIVVIIGPSGSGKSTLLRCLNGIVNPDSGSIARRNPQVAMQARAWRKPPPFSGMVFQRFHLFANLNALENVTLGLRRVRGLSRREADEHGRALLLRFGLGEKAASSPYHLSGGQQQRVAIARAIAPDPTLLLLDEPTSALDPETVGEVLDALRVLAADKRTMVIATHEIGFARAIADRIVVMDQGRVVEQGTPEAVLDSPTLPRTRDFLSTITAGHS